jgi:hypothetical protein
MRNLLLKCILTEGESSKEALAEWERSIVFDDLDIGSFKLLPAVYLKCLARGWTGTYALRAKGAYRRTWAENQLLLSRLDSLLSRLTEAKISYVVADEALRLTQFYGDLGIYSLQELRLAAPYGEKGPIGEKLVEGGWETVGQDFGLTWCRNENAFNIRIYWLDDAEFQSSVKGGGNILIQGTLRPILPLEEQLVSLCEREFIAFRELESRWQFVASEILNRGAPSVPRLISTARRRGVSRQLADMFQTLKDELGVNIPDDLIVNLRNSSPNTLTSAKRTFGRLWQNYRTAKTYRNSNLSFPRFLAERWSADSNAMAVKHAVKAGIKFLRSK